MRKRIRHATFPGESECFVAVMQYYWLNLIRIDGASYLNNGYCSLMLFMHVFSVFFIKVKKTCFKCFFNSQMTVFWASMSRNSRELSQSSDIGRLTVKRHRRLSCAAVEVCRQPVQQSVLNVQWHPPTMDMQRPPVCRLLAATKLWDSTRPPVISLPSISSRGYHVMQSCFASTVVDISPLTPTAAIWVQL